MNETIEVPKEHWIEFFDYLSREHHGWIAGLTIRRGSGECVGIQECRLERIDSHGLGGRDEVDLSVSHWHSAYLTRTIKSPVRVVFRRTANGAHQGFEITSADGTVLSVRFLAAASSQPFDAFLESIIHPHEKQRAA